MSIQLIPYKPAGTIGSGPYVLREYKPDTGIDVSAHTAYLAVDRLLYA